MKQIYKILGIIGLFALLGVVFGDGVSPEWKYETGWAVYSVAISSDGNYIVAGSGDDYVYFFDKNGNLLWKYKTEGNVHSVAISADGNYIVAGSGGTDSNLNHYGYVYLFDKNGNLLWKYKTGNGVWNGVWPVAITKSSDDFFWSISHMASTYSGA